MQYLNEKVSYLKGLAEGLGVKDDTKEGKIILAIVDTLEEFADAINDLDEAQAELNDYLEDMDEDLADLEDDYYADEDDDEDGDEYYEIECPHCHETIFVDEDTYYDSEKIECPKCHEMVDLDVIFEDDDDDEDGEE
ncbi:MAG: hypothetical protein QME46_10155 [Thermoanaerobacteraceae bacterium]|nr:hypothetical protein [Thermoanaerobacteraceae bacterium]